MHPAEETAAPAAARDMAWGPMRSFPRALLVILGFDTAVAVFFGLLGPGTFLVALVYTQAIGLSCLCVSWVLHAGRTAVEPLRSALALLLGGGLGIFLGRLYETRSLAAVLHDPRRLSVHLIPLVFFGSATIYFFHLRSTLADERVRRAEQERQAADARLKLLQAQIEPHFLFNTLSNVVQLVETDPRGAQRMLLNLTSYLRGSLDRTRAGKTTLGEELELLRAYLEIQSVRMGARLRWRIECPDELRSVPFPPLLLQPVVENAVRHGLDPEPQGGEVAVTVGRGDGTLEIQVADTGLGLAAPAASGVGLANVRARVHGLSRGRGRMVIQPRQPHGLSVRIAFPLDPERAA